MITRKKKYSLLTIYTYIHLKLHIHTNIHKHTDTPTKIYTDYLNNITKKIIYIQNKIQKKGKN